MEFTNSELNHKCFAEFCKLEDSFDDFVVHEHSESCKLKNVFTMENLKNSSLANKFLNLMGEEIFENIFSCKDPKQYTFQDILVKELLKVYYESMSSKYMNLLREPLKMECKKTLYTKLRIRSETTTEMARLNRKKPKFLFVRAEGKISFYSDPEEFNPGPYSSFDYISTESGYRRHICKKVPVVIEFHQKLEDSWLDIKSYIFGSLLGLGDLTPISKGEAGSCKEFSYIGESHYLHGTDEMEFKSDIIGKPEPCLYFDGEHYKIVPGCKKEDIGSSRVFASAVYKMNPWNMTIKDDLEKIFPKSDFGMEPSNYVEYIYSAKVRGSVNSYPRRMQVLLSSILGRGENILNKIFKIDKCEHVENLKYLSRTIYDFS